MSPKRILVTGASGYIGGRLLQALLEAGYDAKSMVRRPQQFMSKFPLEHDCRYGDVSNTASLVDAFFQIDTVVYLVHSMADDGFVDREVQAAHNVCEAAKKAGIQQIIYLGGLSDQTVTLSDHMKSRHAVGDVLRQSGIPTTEFQASIIIGSGSLSYELIRHLTERLPVMVTPKWVRVKAQPIGVTDVVAYLMAEIDRDVEQSDVFEIGGRDQVSYAQLMQAYAAAKGLQRWIIPVPVLSPGLSSLWLSLFTPIYATVGRKLIASIKHASIVTQPEKTMARFSILPMGVKQAIEMAIENEENAFTKTHWASAYSTSNYTNNWLESRDGNKLIYTKKARIRASMSRCFSPIERIGGAAGWYYWTALWKLRGIVDLFLGGPGHRRGRKHPTTLHQGDFVDWWRVEQIDRPRLLRLKAEMKLPGRAWLEFELKPVGNTKTDLFVTAIFDPSGVMGRVYWWVLYPAHFFMFNGLLRAIRQRVDDQT